MLGEDRIKEIGNIYKNWRIECSHKRYKARHDEWIDMGKSIKPFAEKVAKELFDEHVDNTTLSSSVVTMALAKDVFFKELDLAIMSLQIKTDYPDEEVVSGKEDGVQS